MKQEYSFEMDKIMSEIKKSKAKIVGLQFPDGLKKHAIEIANQIESGTNAKAVIFIGPVYGACDTDNEICKKLGIDLLIHFGHTKFKD